MWDDFWSEVVSHQLHWVIRKASVKHIVSWIEDAKETLRWARVGEHTPPMWTLVELQNLTSTNQIRRKCPVPGYPSLMHFPECFDGVNKSLVLHDFGFHDHTRSCCNKWDFNRLLKDVQKSIIQIYLRNVTLCVSVIDFSSICNRWITHVTRMTHTLSDIHQSSLDRMTY